MDLKELREKAGLSAERVAVELGKSVSTIRFWEAGTYIPSLSPSETLQADPSLPMHTRRIIRIFYCNSAKKWKEARLKQSK